MPFSTWSQLVSSIQDTLNRQDLAAVAADFITLAETQLNRRLRVQDMITLTPAYSITAQATPLPADFKQMRRIRLTGTSPTHKLTYKTPDQMADLATMHEDQAGEPFYFTIAGANLEVERPPDEIYTAEMSYYAKLPALSAGNQTNWLLAKHPDAYLYGALVQSAPYLKDDDRLGVWQSLYQAVIAEIRDEDQQAAYSGGTLSAAIGSIG